MLMNGRYDGFGAEDVYSPPDPGSEYSPRTEYVTPEPEPTTPGAEPTYVELRDDPYNPGAGDVTAGGGDEGTGENANACPSGNFADCSNKYAQKYGGQSSDYMKMFQTGKKTVGDVIGVVGDLGNKDAGQPLTPSQFLSTTNIPNCGVPLARYLCRADESCGMCLYRSAVTETFRAVAGDPPTAQPARPRAMALSPRGARAAQQGGHGVAVTAQSRTRTGAAGGGGGMGVGMLLGGAALAFFLLKK